MIVTRILGSSDLVRVEILNHSGWWQLWLPFVGSLIVAMVAFIGVLLSNRTNGRAITASDERELVRWRREKLLELADTLLNTSDFAAGRLRGCLSWTGTTTANKTLYEVNNDFSTIPMLGRRMTFITDNLDEEVKAVFDAIGELFLFTAEKWERAKHEVGQSSQPTIKAIETEAEKVRVAQRAFVLAVRKAVTNLASAKSA
ncbi:hypothetical protein [Mycobacterium sp.]|uniref:hypothetical protein n=1 Tax=Mycobacterium sp. TaxID=1785 RepID=UPI003D0C963B